MKYQINQEVCLKDSPKAKGVIKAIFANYEEFAMTDVETYDKAMRLLSSREPKLSDSEQQEIQYSISWSKNKGVSIHPESHLKIA